MNHDCTVYLTPRTKLSWSTLDQWLACAWEIDRRRCCALQHEQARLHVRALPDALIYACPWRVTLVSCLGLLRDGPSHFRQPPRGRRWNAPHTALIVALSNRIAQLDRQEEWESLPPGHNSMHFHEVYYASK